MKLKLFYIALSFFLVFISLSNNLRAQEKAQLFKKEMLEKLMVGHRLSIAAYYPLDYLSSNFSRPSPIPYGVSLGISIFTMSARFSSSRLLGNLEYNSFGQTYAEGVINYNYKISTFSFDLMAQFKAIIFRKNVLIFSGGLTFYTTDVLPVNLDKINWTPQQNSVVYLIQLNGMYQILAALHVDKYIWIKNKEMFLRCKLGFPVKTNFNKVSDYQSGGNQSYENKKIYPVFELSFHYNLLPNLRMNPAKMKIL